jgi:ankyrin repeat protein
LEQEDNNGWSPLMVAAASKQLSAVKALIDLGADVNACAKDYSTTLYLACAKGFEDIARVLIDAGADIEAKVSSFQICLV